MSSSNLTCLKIKSKGNVEIAFREESYSLRSNIRIQKDSASWISLSKASLPVMQAVISNDSLKVLDKIGKGYYLNTIDGINDLINTEIDYELLQDFFLGQAIAFDYDGEYKVLKDQNLYLISSERSKKIDKLIKKGKIKDEPILYRCWIEPKNFRCQRVIINLLNQEAELIVDYGKWEEVDGSYFPMYASLKLITPTDSAAMIVDYSKIECSEELSLPFKISESYEPIQMKDE